MSECREHPGEAWRRVDRATLQALLSAYYRDLGWWVESSHGDARDDGGTWLLKRDRNIVLLDVRHWDETQRPQEAVTWLVQDIERAGATGAILVDHRSFSRADHGIADRHGKVRLIDVYGLSAMLGKVPEQQAGSIAPQLPVPEVSRVRDRSGSRARRHDWALWMIALGCLVVFALLVRALLERTADTAMP